MEDSYDEEENLNEHDEYGEEIVVDENKAEETEEIDEL